MEESEIQFEEVSEGELFKWETPGTNVRGVLEKYEYTKLPKGMAHLYTIRTKKGKIIFPAQVILRAKLEDIPIGYIVDITYNGEKTTITGNEAKQFSVGKTKPTEAYLKALGIEMFYKVEDDIVIDV